MRHAFPILLLLALPRLSEAGASIARGAPATTITSGSTALTGGTANSAVVLDASGKFATGIPVGTTSTYGSAATSDASLVTGSVLLQTGNNSGTGGGGGTGSIVLDLGNITGLIAGSTDGIIDFRVNGTSKGSMTRAGAWTLGPTTFTGALSGTSASFSSTVTGSSVTLTGNLTAAREFAGLQLSTAPRTSLTLIFNSTGTLVMNTTDGYLCVSTGSTQTSFVQVFSTATACGH